MCLLAVGADEGELVLETCDFPAQADLDLTLRVALPAELGKAVLGNLQLLLERRFFCQDVLHQLLDPGHGLPELTHQRARGVALLGDALELMIADGELPSQDLLDCGQLADRLMLVFGGRLRLSDLLDEAQG